MQMQTNVNVDEVLTGIFPTKKITTDGTAQKVNVHSVSNIEINKLAELCNVTDVQIRRSGTGLVVVAESIAD